MRQYVLPQGWYYFRALNYTHRNMSHTEEYSVWPSSILPSYLCNRIA